MYLSERASLAATLSNSQRAKGCVAYDPTARKPTYGYDPHLAAGIIFTVAFGLSTLAHVVQVSVSRKWWFSVFAVGAIGEAVGWAARAAAHHCPYNKTLFSLQISILIISPCFFSAGIYVILGKLIAQYGYRYSPISPKMYLAIFVSFDLLSIIIQGVGGGLASSAGGKDPPGNTNIGTHTMLAGIIIQLISMSCFALLWLYFVWRARNVGYSRTLVIATSFSAFCIIVRNFYRAVELAQGWSGYLITHEAYFAVLDGALMVMATGVFNVFFPSKYLSDEAKIGGSGAAMELASPKVV